MEKGRGGALKEMGRKPDVKVEKAPERPVSLVEQRARKPRHTEHARRALRADYEAFKRKGDAVAQSRHQIEKRFLEKRSVSLTVAMEKGEIGRPQALLLARYFPHLSERKVKEIAKAFPERRWTESAEEFRKRVERVRKHLRVDGLGEHELRAILEQCGEMLEAYSVLEERGIRHASPNWPRRSDGSPRKLMVNRSALLSIAYDVYKEGHPDKRPELREGLPHKKYEYRNERGEIVARGYAQYERVDVTDHLRRYIAENPAIGSLIARYSLGPTPRRLVNFFVDIPKTGKRIDILRMTGAKNAIVMAPEFMMPIDGMKINGTRLIFINEPKNARQLWVALHEFGHHDQGLDLAFRGMAGDYVELTSPTRHAHAQDVVGYWKAVKKMLTSAKHKERDQLLTPKDCDEGIAALEELNRFLAQNGGRQINLRCTSTEEIRDAKNFVFNRNPEVFYRLNERIERANQKLGRFWDWRKMYSERDATRRSFVWMRELKRAGANFHYKEPISLEESRTLLGTYEGSKFSQTGFADYQEIARAALATYGAGNSGFDDFYGWNLPSKRGARRLPPATVDYMREQRKQRERFRHRP